MSWSCESLRHVVLQETAISLTSKIKLLRKVCFRLNKILMHLCIRIRVTPKEGTVLLILYVSNSLES